MCDPLSTVDPIAGKVANSRRSAQYFQSGKGRTPIHRAHGQLDSNHAGKDGLVERSASWRLLLGQSTPAYHAKRVRERSQRHAVLMSTISILEQVQHRAYEDLGRRLMNGGNNCSF